MAGGIRTYGLFHFYRWSAECVVSYSTFSRDLSRGGKVPMTKPGETIITENGVIIVAHLNVASTLAADASALYAKNLLNFLSPLVNEQKNGLNIDWEDKIITGTLLTKDGEVVHERLKGGN